jgi:hypothetical protein
MKNKLRNGIALSLIPQIIIVKWLAGHPDWVEKYYSNGLYPIVSRLFRTLFGWIPFSVGEIIYTVLIVLAVRYVFRNWKKIKVNKRSFVRDVVMVFSVFYLTFHLTWALNYYRQPLSQKLGIENAATFEELKSLAQKLVVKTNALQHKITNDSTAMVQVPYSRKEIFDKTIVAYSSIEEQLPYLAYERPSIKKSMFSVLSSYMGIGGYLNPFTNEAQVNRKTPLFRFPVVTGHEIAHQVGYSAENETNFIGYLVTLKSQDIYFQYSAYAYALSYSLNAIHRTDKNASKELYERLNSGVLKNYKELQEFHEAYENPFEPIFKSVFSTFLKANNQADGIQSYGKVVNLMVGYHQRYGI